MRPIFFLAAESREAVKHLPVYLDGLPFEAGFREVAPMRHVLAIEAYPDAHPVPAA